MANEEQLSILKQGVNEWNKWRKENEEVIIDLSNAYLNSANLSEINLYQANLQNAKLEGANLFHAILYKANLSYAHLSLARLGGANMIDVDLSYANLNSAQLGEAELRRANLHGATLNFANLGRAYLREANLCKAHLYQANLSFSDLDRADLTGADLELATLTGSYVGGAIISKSKIYGINVWGLKGEFKEQKELIISVPLHSQITVDNVEVAQFVTLILNNSKIRGVLDTLTSKAVLILGRFAILERKAILDSLKSKLTEYGLLPIVFDFERPTDKDFTETIKTLAGLCYFVIADITNPKSSPLELQAAVPDYQIPFVPIIQEGESPFAMMVDLQKKYNWVLNTVSYDSEETLMKILKPLIIDPAMNKRNELRLIKAQIPDVISGKDFLAKGEL